MRAYNPLRQTGLVASPVWARQGLLNASGLARHQQGRRAMAFSTDRANTIGFIGLGAMGNHMVGYCDPAHAVFYLT